MQFTTENVSTAEQQRVVVASVIDEVEATHGYSVTRKWRPTLATVTWERNRGGDAPWGKWRAINVLVSGRNVLATGALGADHKVRMYGPESSEYGGLAEVYEAAMRTVPTGDLPSPYRVQRVPIRPASVGGTEG